MDRKFLIEQRNNKIAGFQHLVKRNREKVWCAECAIADNENPPFIANRTELSLPDFENIDGSISPILHQTYDQYAEMEGDNPKITQDLSDETCDECGQTLQPD